jgi:arylsulfatase A-like enzyme
MKLYNQAEIDHLIAAYDAEIYAADKEIGIILDYLRDNGLYDNSIIVITADHGESLDEHDYYFEHGEYYYDTTALIPLAIKRPYQNTPALWEYQVRNIDIFPTILGELDLQAECEGKNLFPKNVEDERELRSMLAFGENDYNIHSNNTRRYIEGIAGKWRIARSNRWKLIMIPHPENTIYEFYDIVNDPGEERNLIASPEYQNEFQYLKTALLQWIKTEDMYDTEQIPPEQIPDDMRERLRSLGYVR